jgi:hypothetical protein
VKPTFLALCLGLAACGATSGASAGSTLPATPAAPASAAVRATRAASAACASPAASMPRRGHAVTSKVRHIPDEGDPCADSTGVAPPSPR